MKLFLVIFFFIGFSTCQILLGQELVTAVRTEQERQDEQWENKITDQKEVNGQLLQLVTSNEKDSYFVQWLSIQVLDMQTGDSIQVIEVEQDLKGDTLSLIDCNFDGYDDLEFISGGGVLDNYSTFYMLYDPITKTFDEDSYFGGSNVEFYEDSTMVSVFMSNRCCAGTYYAHELYTFCGNKLVSLEQHCMTSRTVDEDGYDVDIVDEDGNIDFKEIDCDFYFLDLKMQSNSKQDTNKYRFVIFDEDHYGGFVQQLDSVDAPRIPLYLDLSENKNGQYYRYNRMLDNEANGYYEIEQPLDDNSNIIYFVPQGSKKKIAFKVLSQN